MVQTKKSEEILYPSCPYVCIYRSFRLLFGAYVYPSAPFICPSLSWAGSNRNMVCTKKSGLVLYRRFPYCKFV